MTRTADSAPPSTSALATISFVTMLGMGTMGISLPILPPQLHLGYGYDLTTVGWVIGLESIATLISRPWSGRVADRRGGKSATLLGLGVMILCGLAYALSDFTNPATGAGRSLALLAIIVGRVLMGVGEGLLIAGSGLWGIDRAGPGRTGRAVSWVGLGMFAGLAIGSAAGAAIDYGQPHGFALAALASMLVPALAMAICAPIGAGALYHDHEPVSLRSMMSAVALPGFALLANACGFAAVTSFLALDYTAQGWTALPLGGTGTGVFGFGAGHVCARVLFSDVTDRIRGPWLAVACLLVQAVGLATIWQAGTPLMALIGAIVTGFGFSMVYPLLTVPVFSAVPAQKRGTALGLFDGFFDAGAGVAALASGVVAHYLALPQVFLVVSATALAGVAPVLLVPRERWRPGSQDAS
ncbi:major facilitator superfamily transporter [Acetobacter nitrogenifigens DSM 23921 = NBRC 105050]|uniref:UPF0226 protein n=1 Tax=Acetobacter nitrogenifigens DSM 23921 = NBRC 105050 TaxID=1120919 RepID=A0A511X6G1_9PROT|nr:MFS transporter [Acetobacter nitrogenifigens]GBQ94496.1 major facilitator superfamily transporter [Acetobacter nitrogenifigens DSM 23921 = NBRC 105050]GEN58538.1 UPF0226 protein [Acetobacter nitrogenifigens DSM 23921 = NBRC 105050]